MKLRSMLLVLVFAPACLAETDFQAKRREACDALYQKARTAADSQAVGHVRPLDVGQHAQPTCAELQAPTR